MKKVEVVLSELAMDEESLEKEGMIILGERFGDRFLCIMTDLSGIFAIKNLLSKTKSEHLFIHELAAILMIRFGGKVKEITITSWKEGDVLSASILTNRGKIRARPSDAIFLALYFQVPMFASEKILTENPEDLSDEEETSIPSNELLSPLEQLKKTLKDAIEKEDYEKAAALRDEIKKISGNANTSS
ncbi:MAG: bifunctional nuclease domain-containing protein [Candidatus Paceibacterota bacterium]|jgi:hypothetical protein